MELRPLGDKLGSGEMSLDRSSCLCVCQGTTNRLGHKGLGGVNVEAWGGGEGGLGSVGGQATKSETRSTNISVV